MKDEEKTIKRNAKGISSVNLSEPHEPERLEFQILKAKANAAIKQAKNTSLQFEKTMLQFEKVLTRLERVRGIKKRPLSFPLGEA